mmetsp:Transcript_50912/g.108111  ORF Transcript_50912/g.108111 Transcript_50912/m.108111 type:complete len:146 (+) Transcript_50912:234-671(+)
MVGRVAIERVAGTGQATSHVAAAGVGVKVGDVAWAWVGEQGRVVSVAGVEGAAAWHHSSWLGACWTAAAGIGVGVCVAACFLLRVDLVQRQMEGGIRKTTCCNGGACVGDCWRHRSENSRLKVPQAYLKTSAGLVCLQDLRPRVL